MKLEEIHELWDKDCKIDKTNLSIEAIRIGELHSKYWKLFSHERMTYLKQDIELKTLKHEKMEFYTQGPSKETLAKGWTAAPIGRVLRSDVQSYLDADKEMIDSILRVGVQKEKMALLESIINNINWRKNDIKNFIDYERFRAGN